MNRNKVCIPIDTHTSHNMADFKSIELNVLYTHKWKYRQLSEDKWKCEANDSKIMIITGEKFIMHLRYHWEIHSVYYLGSISKTMPNPNRNNDAFNKQQIHSVIYSRQMIVDFLILQNSSQNASMYLQSANPWDIQIVGFCCWSFTTEKKNARFFNIWWWSKCSAYMLSRNV